MNALKSQNEFDFGTDKVFFRSGILESYPLCTKK
jgi:hypothetical protein